MAASHDPVAKVTQLAADMLAQSAARAASAAAREAENRARFPDAYRVKDLFAVFSPRLTFAREGDDELGKCLDTSRAVKPAIPWRSHDDTKPRASRRA